MYQERVNLEERVELVRKLELRLNEFLSQTWLRLRLLLMVLQRLLRFVLDV